MSRVVVVLIWPGCPRRVFAARGVLRLFSGVASI